MLLVGMEHFTARLLRLVMLGDGGDREIDQIVVVIDPDMQDRLKSYEDPAEMYDVSAGSHFSSCKSVLPRGCVQGVS